MAERYCVGITMAVDYERQFRTDDRDGLDVIDNDEHVAAFRRVDAGRRA